MGCCCNESTNDKQKEDKICCKEKNGKDTKDQTENNYAEKKSCCRSLDN